MGPRMREGFASLRILLGLLVCLGLLGGLMPVPAQARGDEEPVAEVQEEAQEEAPSGAGEEHGGFGAVPDPTLTPSIHEEGEEEPSGAVNLPSSYSSVAQGKVTYAKNQDYFGTCWAFATLGAIESSMLGAGLADSYQTLDLSERHTIDFTYHNQPDLLGNTAGDFTEAKDALFGGVEVTPQDPYLWTGGNYARTARALASWMGPVDESAVPSYDSLLQGYNRTFYRSTYIGPENVKAHDRFYADTLLDPSLSHAARAATVTGVSKIKMTDRDDVKQAIMDHGAVGVSIKYANWYFASLDGTYCCDNLSDERLFGHAVTLVGWDDDMSAEVFMGRASQNGAWLARNSWGRNWGNSEKYPDGTRRGGYFWISYDDASLNTDDAGAYCFDVAPADAYDNIYQYDGSGGTCWNYVYSGGSIANVYQARANCGGSERLEAVSFWLEDANVNYTIQVFTNLNDPKNPESGTPMLDLKQTGRTTYAGYTTAVLHNPINLTEGTSFSVVVTLAKSGQRVVSYDVDTTYGKGSRYSDHNSCLYTSYVAPNQSFERDSAGASWDDLSAARYDTITKDGGSASDEPACCARLKAFTRNVGGLGTPMAHGSTWARLSGKNALATMEKIVQAEGVFTAANVNVVVVASADGYKDALAATALAGCYGAPVLITPKRTLGAQTRSELVRLKPQTVYVAGGPAAVTDSVVNAIKKALPSGTTVARVYGSNAVGTSVELYNKGKSAPATWGGTAIVATSNGYKDALSIAPYAYAKHAPIFLALPSADPNKRTLASNVLSAIKGGGFTRVIIVGGAKAVSGTVEGQLAGTGIEVMRLQGSDALGTSAAIANFELTQGMSLAHMAVATTASYKDALTGAALAGAQKSVLVLANPTKGYTAFDAVFKSRYVAHGHVLGGPVAISDASLSYFKNKA